jgi:hypothetical protein
MPLVRECTAPRCGVLTMGVLCVDHESTVKIRLEPLAVVTHEAKTGEEQALLSVRVSL